MSDEEFLETFEACRLSPGSLDHEGHVRLTWIVLHRASLLKAIERLTHGFQKFATSQGKPELYHETMTWTFILLIHDRIQRKPNSSTWKTFQSENPDLFSGKNLLQQYFLPQTLSSDLARQTFLFPDRCIEAR